MKIKFNSDQEVVDTIRIYRIFYLPTSNGEMLSISTLPFFMLIGRRNY